MSNKGRAEIYVLRHISMSTHKVRIVINQIRGCDYGKALEILRTLPYRASRPIFQMVLNAGANANYVMGSDKKHLKIIKAEVNEGTPMKKLITRSKGRSYLVTRPSCHISIVVRDDLLYNKLNDRDSNGGLWDKK